MELLCRNKSITLIVSTVSKFNFAQLTSAPFGEVLVVARTVYRRMSAYCCGETDNSQTAADETSAARAAVAVGLLC